MIPRIALAAMFMGTLVPAGFTQSAPLFELPAPTGKSPIGTTRWVVKDTSRAETFAHGKTREVEVIAWYPAVASVAPTAPYMRDGMEEVLSFARLAKLGSAFDGLATVKTHAVLDAMPAASPARFPVIVFSHGYTGLPSSHTSLFEDLASHGWAVLSAVHPYEATGSMLADGTVITFLNEKGTMHQGIMDVLNEWGPEGGTMEKVTAATDEAEKQKLLRGYLATLKNTDAVVKRWVLDTKLALDRLPKDAAAGRLAARLDLSRLGVAGHSMGGVVAGQFCVEDRRCKAGRVDVKDTLHLDFTDLNFWGGPLRQRGAHGAIAPSRAAEVTRTIVREFFGQEILGQKSGLLAGEQQWDGVTVGQLRKP